MTKSIRCLLIAAAAIWLQSCVQPEDAFLEETQRSAFEYFRHEAGSNGLIQDRMTDKQLSSTMAGGYQLSAWCVAAERGWVKREVAAQKVLQTLKTYESLPRFHGIFAHFYDIQTGKAFTPVWANQLDDGADLSETGFLMGGVLTCRQYFSRDEPAEREIRQIATRLYEDVEWDWMLQDRFGNRQKTLSWHWSPNHGFAIGQRIRSTMEMSSMITYLLAIGSPTHPIPADCWQDGWARDYRWGTYAGHTFITCPPLFAHQYAQTWIDMRNKRDGFTDYFRNSTYATLANRDYCVTKLYPGQEIWGLTFSDGPDGYGLFGYPPKVCWETKSDIDLQATVAPTGPAGSMPFTPHESLRALKTMRARYGEEVWGKYGFVDALSPKKNWFDKDYIAIDQGPIVTMIENHRSGLIWKYFMQNECIWTALDLTGFVAVIDDFEQAKDVAAYAEWTFKSDFSFDGFKISPGPARAGESALRFVLGKDKSNGTFTDPAIFFMKAPLNDLSRYRYLSFWMRGPAYLSPRLVLEGRSLPLEKAAEVVSADGWTHFHYVLPTGPLKELRGITFAPFPVKEGAEGEVVVDEITLTNQLDVEPPAGVETFGASLGTTPGEIHLAWKPGTSGAKDIPFRYVIKVSEKPIESEKAFAKASSVASAQERIGGTETSLILPGMETGKTYYFAIRAQDRALNVSQFSTCKIAVPKVEVMERIVLDDFEDGSVRMGPAQWLGDDKVFTFSSATDPIKEGNRSLKVDYKKTRKNDEWAFIEVNLDHHNFANHRYLVIWIQGNAEILAKVWHKPDFEEDLATQTARGEGWTRMVFDLSKLESVDRRLIRKLLLFVQPGKTDCSGTFYVDSISLTNKAD